MEVSLSIFIVVCVSIFSFIMRCSLLGVSVKKVPILYVFHCNKYQFGNRYELL